jgi:DNA-binding GntR family transcriptional regulator
MIEGAYKLPLVQTLPDQVYDIIKQQIVTHRLRPGEPLVEKSMAEQLGVSTTPVREALLRLEYEALVTKMPYAGARVAEISSQDARDIFEVRSVLEGLAARLATSVLREDDFERAAQCIRASEAALSECDYKLCAEEGRRFHALMLEKVDNKALHHCLQLLSGHIERVRNITSRVLPATAESIHEHSEILQNLQRRDASSAEQAMRHHITRTFDQLTPEIIDAALGQLGTAAS